MRESILETQFPAMLIGGSVQVPGASVLCLFGGIPVAPIHLYPD
jgi:hypothetical protein